MNNEEYFNSFHYQDFTHQNNKEKIKMTTYIKIGLGILGALTTVLLLKENKAETDTKTVSKTDNYLEEDDYEESDCEEAEYEEPEKPLAPQMLKRGDRFTCPDTGEQLQVRAVGGRPRKV